MNSLPKTVTRQRRGCDLKQRPSALESSTLTTRLPGHPSLEQYNTQYPWSGFLSGDHLGEPIPENIHPLTPMGEEERGFTETTRSALSQ